MHIEDMKRWHWALIAVGIGLALSYAWSNVEWGDQLPTLAQADFERGAAAKFPQPGHIANITVLPHAEKGVEAVVCEQLRRTNNPKVMEFRPALFRAPVPFKSERGGQTYNSISAYLNEVKSKANPELSYKYAWYRETWAVYALWTSASLLLIAGVWPSAVSLMTGGGLGLTREKSNEPEYDLSRYGKGKPTPKPGANLGPSEQDMEEVRRLDEELERQLAAGLTGGAVQGAELIARSDQAVRKLDGGPLEAAQVQASDEEKEYGGEFYPVVKAVHKKDEHHTQPHEH